MSVLAPKEGMLRRYDDRGRAKATRYTRRILSRADPGHEEGSIAANQAVSNIQSLLGKNIGRPVRIPIGVDIVVYSQLESH